jgi:hypothetical protein
MWLAARRTNFHFSFFCLILFDFIQKVLFAPMVIVLFQIQVLTHDGPDGNTFAGTDIISFQNLRDNFGQGPWVV